MTLPYQQIAVADFETFYDDVVSLKKMSMTDYIRHDEFEAQTCSITIIDAKGKYAKAKSYVGYEAIANAFGAIDWTVTALCAHHAQFDGHILTHHFGVYPCFWICTLSMARVVYGVDDSVGLNNLAIKLGLKGKVHGSALTNVKGVRIKDMDKATIKDLCQYNNDDTNDTAAIYTILSKFIPEDEMALMDITIRMYCEPVLIIDAERVKRVNAMEIQRKAELFERIGIEQDQVRKDKVFAAALEGMDVPIPMKFSLKQKNADGTHKLVHAFAKSDYEFKALLEHPNEEVVWLVEARLASKSSLVETRSASIMRRAGRPTPIYLNHWGARTGRWSGGDSVNWQNLPRRGLGAELRKSLCAPNGTSLIISDAAQIEARMLAWLSGQDDITDTFARNEDVYALAAGNVYGRVIDKDRDKDERFVGKVLTLGAGYGAGHLKINFMLKIGAFGPSVIQTVEETQDLVRAWRTANHMIVKEWKKNNNNMMSAFLSNTIVDDGLIVFEGTKRGGYMHLPNGTYIFYPQTHVNDEGNFAYVSRNGPVKLYGGIITENKDQALSRALIGHQMLLMQEEMPDTRFASTTHDEVLMVAPKRRAEEYAHNVNRLMSTTAPWCPGLPLNAETHVSEIYDKS